ncbi:right-handed parallel beta-helix repeat-containing protein [Methylobacterium sp. sgz302003]|uniref:right-handed parallel beta-helix repeat-containing protein n=1 Tax=Methylobacterium oryzisoli TaxID=3385502 RepID=UPI00397986D7
MASSPIPLTRYNGTIYAKSGDVIENLDIYTDGVGIELEDDDNVTIRNVRIHYNGANQGSAGIDAVGADGLTIQGVEVINAGAPASGPNSDGGEFGVSLFSSPGASVNGVTVRDASTGVYLQESPNATLEGIEGYNMRGPFPRGQLVQFNRSGDSSLNNFSVFNDLDTAWTEDNIHIGEGSDGITVTNGLIDGNNSPSGVGVMLEGAQNTVVRNVDVVHMGNGAFTDIGSNNLFDDVRSFDNFADSQAGRGTPMSGSLIFGLADDTTITNGAYQNPANPENVVYGGGIQDDAFGGTYQATEISGQSPMAGWHNTFSWS